MTAKHEDPAVEVDRLKSAMRRAHHCLVDGRRVGDAIKVLKVAFPGVGQPDPDGDPKPRGKSAA